jgi:hypothetical protein
MSGSEGLPPGEGEERRAEEVPLPGGDFRMFVTRLSVQAMLSLGLLDNPLTGKKTLQLDHARMTIDDLVMLRMKTAGNLRPEEADHLAKVVEDLEAHYGRLRG